MLNKSYASVVPPPSRYPTSQAGNTGAVNGQPLPYTETTNVLSHPSGLEYQLSVGEGASLSIQIHYDC